VIAPDLIFDPAPPLDCARVAEMPTTTAGLRKEENEDLQYPCYLLFKPSRPQRNFSGVWKFFLIS